MKIIITAGGSGGHLFPAEKLARELIKRGDEVIICGHGLKKSLLFKKEFSFQEIRAAPMKNPFTFLFATGVGLIQAIRLILRFQPSLVIGFGSYHTFTVLLGATLLRKRIILFEANTLLGKVNRFFSPFASKIVGQFPLSKKTGLAPMLPWGFEKKPVSKIEAKNHYSLGPGFTILVLGGSQGATFFNQIMPHVAKRLEVQWIHLTGKGKTTSYNATIKEFEENIEIAYRAADMVIARAGASTIGELILHKKPALLIPYPYSAENHQGENAQFFSEVVRGGRALNQSFATADKICDEILYIQKNLGTLEGSMEAYGEEKRPSLSEVFQ